MLTHKWRKALLIVAMTVIALVASASWYRAQYSMAVASTFEVNDPHSSPRVLIATQGSAFKEAVVAGVVHHLRSRSAYVRVIDISMLPEVNVDEWAAVVILHTWEMRTPPAAVKAFVESSRDRQRIVALTTSGAGDFKIDGVDAISSASRMADVPLRVADVTRKLDHILEAARRD